ncbi:MAG: hypothetical protein IKD36_02525 [Clostridia bacterium]|nr:hypothetical protein [Clostridia bacterium]
MPIKNLDDFEVSEEEVKELQAQETAPLAEGATVEKIDLSAVKKERDRESFYNTVESLLNDVDFANKCKKYLKIKEDEKTGKTE